TTTGYRRRRSRRIAPTSASGTVTPDEPRVRASPTAAAPTANASTRSVSHRGTSRNIHSLSLGATGPASDRGTIPGSARRRSALALGGAVLVAAEQCVEPAGRRRLGHGVEPRQPA